MEPMPKGCILLFYQKAISALIDSCDVPRMGLSLSTWKLQLVQNAAVGIVTCSNMRKVDKGNWFTSDTPDQRNQCATAH